MEKYYSRKSLRLKSFDYAQESIYFLTICTENRRPILGWVTEPESEADEPRIRLSAIGRVVDQYTSTIKGIDKYIIMPNHVHMIVKNKEGEDISTKIRSWKTLIYKQIREKIWQRSFYDHVIRDERDYQIRWEYIDRNPSKWAMDEYYRI